MQEYIDNGKPLLTLESPDNSELMALGAKPVQPDNITPFVFPKPLPHSDPQTQS